MRKNGAKPDVNIEGAPYVLAEGAGEHEKILVLEGAWEEGAGYVTDARSVSRVYQAVETLARGFGPPVHTVTRPLLAQRFVHDVEAFTQLPGNRRGPNVVVLSAHSCPSDVDSKADSRKGAGGAYLAALDGEPGREHRALDLFENLGKLGENGALTRTIVVLDTCLLGDQAKKLQKVSGALGVVAYRQLVDWIDCLVFTLAMLLKWQEAGVFSMKRVSAVRPARVFEELKRGDYSKLARSLGAVGAFAK